MLRRGETFAGYVIERELGRGGMGAVYAARHPRLPRLTALKLLHREMFGDDELRVRFEREGDVVAQLDHPNIITVFDRGIEDDRLWISMQYVDGPDSATVPRDGMSAERAVQIVVQTAAALDYAHGKGILHRDVKPANLLLSRSAGVGAGFDERVLLTDFGIAKLLDDTGQLTRTGNLTATLAYAAPEQLTNTPLDHRCDQYALACTLFRLITGFGPYDAPSVGAVVFGHIQGPIPSIRAAHPELPAELDAVLARAMAKDPAQRYDSCGEFAEAARSALRDPARLALTLPPHVPDFTAPSGPEPTRRVAPRLIPDLSVHSSGDHRIDETASTSRGLRDSGTRADPEPTQHNSVHPSTDRTLRRGEIPLGRTGYRPSARGTHAITAHPPLSPHDLRDAVLGCLLGGAVGDALGAPIESLDLERIRRRYGPRGLTSDPAAYEGRISDETQLTLFTVEALIKGSQRARERGVGGATLGLMQQGFLVWLQGQGVTIPEQPVPLHSSLAAYPELMQRRGVSHAASTALQQAGARRAPTDPLGTRSAPVNDSKGCAAVVRAAPCGFGYASDSTGAVLEHVFELGCDAAALTHGHRSGWLPAGAMAALIYRLCRGASLSAALDDVRTELAHHDGHQETTDALTAAVDLAARTTGDPRAEHVETLGSGWVGPEALAIAVYSALSAESVGGSPEAIFRTGVLLSVNHSGDSDSTASLCGHLLGAHLGRTAIPSAWVTPLDAAPVITTLANAYYTEFGPAPVTP
ncbi:ADP-ribosylglycohydrolase family protein [Nocardia puris]|uniref:ADP-ribosylglycohydrolase family protein n=1 Tax=Nocardia puris TaxID=208602 RepID=UPI001893B972|nr:ADP-ribosylglycohydrolase family protein [Nocardia puris]MBF6210958.1 ADP-ribosylglycohydrolase family protein [Nocardia puris]MBF6364554.1 ADP-ribosylglycohydrolase family protein [Nocardia puris]MBF6459483.1 ADP-ribosylglycohydrolase family protein [Nocardia puris]